MRDKTNPDVTRRRLLVAAGGLLPLSLSTRLLAATGTKLQWGSATLGSTGYVIIETFTHIVNKHTDIRNSALATSGTTENIVLLNAGQIDLGQSASVDWGPATAGTAPFQEPTKAQQMFSYTTWAMPPIVRANSDIKSIADLAGRRASPGASGASTRAIWEPIFQAAGLQDKVRWSYGSWREIYDAFKAGSLECVPALLVNGAPSAIVQELMLSEEIRVLDIPADVLQKAQAINAGITAMPASDANWDLPSLEGGVLLPGSSGILAAHPDLDEEVAYVVTKAIFENEKEAKSISKELAGLELSLATRYLVPGIPVNRGAARYFKEQGVWRDDLTVAQ